MAKKPPVNKAQTIRDYLKTNPGISNKEITEALSKQGIIIPPNYIANIKSKMSIFKDKRKRRSNAAKAISVISGVGVREIKAAFVLIKHCGGIDNAKKALDAAREIKKII